MDQPHIATNPMYLKYIEFVSEKVSILIGWHHSHPTSHFLHTNTVIAPITPLTDPVPPKPQVCGVISQENTLMMGFSKFLLIWFTWERKSVNIRNYILCKTFIPVFIVPWWAVQPEEISIFLSNTASNPCWTLVQEWDYELILLLWVDRGQVCPLHLAVLPALPDITVVHHQLVAGGVKRAPATVTGDI